MTCSFYIDMEKVEKKKEKKAENYINLSNKSV